MATANPEFKRTIIIGLGGGGELILTHLKRFFLDEYNVLPPSIRLLCLDTDPDRVAVRSSLSEKQITLDDHESLYMKVAQPSLFIDSSKEVQDWFIAPVPAGSIDRGAGAVRQNGRLALFYHINNFMRRIDAMYEALGDQGLHDQMAYAKERLGATKSFRLSKKATSIHVCGSLAGGTGSGSFLDVAILLRNIFPDALIHGFFLLNWIYRNKAFAYRVQGNVYAALAELDNIQSIWYGAKDFVPYEMTYADKAVTVRKPPYDLVNLIDGRNEIGENINEVGALCETVATAIFLSVSAMGDPVDSVEDNLLAHINVQSPRIWNGRFARYSSLGVSSIYYPAKELYELKTCEEAHRLCTQAMEELEGTEADASRATDMEHIENDVKHLFGNDQLNLLNRAYVQDKVCPVQMNIALPVKTFHISDKQFPKLIRGLLEKEEKKLKQKIDESFKDNEKIFIEGTVWLALEQKTTEIEKDSKLDAAYLQRWIDVAVGLLEGQNDAVTSDINQEDDNVRNYWEDAEALLKVAQKARFFPGFGGPRKTAVANWTARVVRLFNAIRNKKKAEFERQVYERLINLLRAKSPSRVKAPSEVIAALRATQGELEKISREEWANYRLLESKSNHIIVGGGHIVVVPWQEDSVSGRESTLLNYREFKADKNIHKAEDFAGETEKLVELFRGYCRNKLKELKDVSVHQAIETVGERRYGNKDTYTKELFSHLFRSAAALWCYDEGRINELQQLQYDRIVNLGVFEKQEGINNYDGVVNEVKGTYSIRADHTFSTTGDPQRIWLLNFAATLPVYFLSDLDHSKKRYEEEMTPTYHIDKQFESELPDLFPAGDVENISLRVLGMAIVKGIDVIHDEKLPPRQGHIFTFDDQDSVEKLNYGKPIKWRLFRDMYKEITDGYNPEDRGNNLLDILMQLLREKVDSMRNDNESNLRGCIERHIAEVKKKLDSRDFTRLISARLTYREVKELEEFLSKKGYDMDIKRYFKADKIG
jgi:hypothetical protein